MGATAAPHAWRECARDKGRRGSGRGPAQRRQLSSCGQRAVDGGSCEREAATASASGWPGERRRRRRGAWHSGREAAAGGSAWGRGGGGAAGFKLGIDAFAHTRRRIRRVARAGWGGLVADFKPATRLYACVTGTVPCGGASGLQGAGGRLYDRRWLQAGCASHPHPLFFSFCFVQCMAGGQGDASGSAGPARGGGATAWEGRAGDAVAHFKVRPYRSGYEQIEARLYRAISRPPFFRTH